MIKVGFIDYYLDEWHANNYVHMLHDYSNGEVEAVYAWAEIDSPEGGLTTDAWCEKYGLTRMMTQEELIEKSDVLLAVSYTHLVQQPGAQRLPRCVHLHGRRVHFHRYAL